MSLSCRRLASLSLLAVLAGASVAANAAPPTGHGRVERGPAERDAREHAQRDDQRTLSDSVRRAQRATRGQVLSAERVQSDGRDMNRVKLVDDRGRVRTYWDDPQARPERQPERDAPPPTRRDDGDDPTL